MDLFATLIPANMKKRRLFLICMRDSAKHGSRTLDLWWFIEATAIEYRLHSNHNIRNLISSLIGCCSSQTNPTSGQQNHDEWSRWTIAVANDYHVPLKQHIWKEISRATMGTYTKVSHLACWSLQSFMFMQAFDQGNVRLWLACLYKILLEIQQWDGAY